MKRHTLAIVLTCLSIIGKNVLGQLPAMPGGLPFKLPSGIPGAGGGQLPQLGPEQKACFQSFVDQGMQTCLQHMSTSFQTQKISLDPSCCDFINKIGTSCKSVLHFQSAGFESKVSAFCSGAGGGPPAA